MLRVLLCIPLVLLYTIGLGVPAVSAGLVDRSGRLPHAVCRLWSRLLLRTCGVRVLVSGETGASPGPAVYAANHGSALDIPILFGYLPVDFRVIHKRSLYFIPVVGWFLYVAGHIGIDRANPFRARKSLEAAADRIRAGTNVVVFPEGTRSAGEAVQAFKRGSFVLALNAGVPVVPVSLVGVKKVIPRGVFTLRPGTVGLCVHPEVPTAGRGVEAAQALAEEVRKIVVRGCEEAVA
jgi:1-acyl-sn-glycerol-3-phosphate acyltransferase